MGDTVVAVQDWLGDDFLPIGLLLRPRQNSSALTFVGPALPVTKVPGNEYPDEFAILEDNEARRQRMRPFFEQIVDFDIV